MNSEEAAVHAGQQQASNTNVKKAFPALHPGLLERLVYYSFEPLWWLIWWWHRGRIHGAPCQQSCILVANHGSYLDWILPHVLLRRIYRRNIHYLVKEKVVQSALFRVFTRSTDSIAMRDDQKAAAVKKLSRLLAEAPSDETPMLGIFPEGTRSRNGRPLPGMRGAAWMARLLKVPIQPVALCGFYEAWPPGRWFPRVKRQGLSVHFLEPVYPDAIKDDQQAIDGLMEQIYAVVGSEPATL